VASNLAGDKRWVIDANRNVYVYSGSGTLLVTWTAGSLANNSTPQGIATNGADIWVVDSKSDKVFQYAGAASRLSGTQTAASSFSLNSGNANATDIVTDGQSFWVVDDTAKTDKVFKYSLTGSLSGSWTIDAANKAPAGIAIDPVNVSHIWIVDSGTDRVYQYSGAASRISGNQTAALSFALAAGNANPQGIADPPAAVSTTGAEEPRNSIGASLPELTFPIHLATDNVTTSHRRADAARQQAFALLTTRHHDVQAHDWKEVSLPSRPEEHVKVLHQTKGKAELLEAAPTRGAGLTL
jgi:hypothetical protein